MSTWNALNFAEASGDPDNIIALIQRRREIFVIKQKTTEIWGNVSTSGFVFAREQGPFLEAGCVAPASVSSLGETVFWLAQNNDGNGIVVKLTGYNLERVSTHYIEREIQSWGDMSTAIGFAYQQEGHTFYVLSSLNGNQTWVYDDTVSTQARQPMWHQRGRYTSTEFGSQPHHSPVNCAAFFNGLNLVGDDQSANIYSYSLDNFTDNGVDRLWLRSWRALPQESGKIQKFSSLRIGMQTGVDVPPATNPTATLEWSDDGGHNFVGPLVAAIGQSGQTSARVKFNRLGALRAEVGYDRIFRLSGGAPIPPVLIDSFVESTP
jgi:hypothetical protein